MDPNQYAMNYDQQFSRVLAQRSVDQKLRSMVLSRCLQLGQPVLSQAQKNCVREEYTLLQRYLRKVRVDPIHINIMLGKSGWKLKSQVCKDHPDQHCTLLCLQDDCSKKGPICSECQIFTHNSHFSKPITLALSEVAKDLEPLPSALLYIIKLDNLRIKFQQVVSRLGKNRQQVDVQIDRFFKVVHDKVNGYRGRCARILNLQQMNQQLWRLLQHYKFYQRSEQELSKSNFQLYLNDILKQIENRCTQFQQAVSKREDTNELMKLLTPLESQIKLNFLFSQIHHHSSIEVTDGGLTVTQQNNYSTNFAYIEPMLEGKRSLQCKRTIKFKINKITSWLSLGVAYLSFGQKANYYFNTGNTGHGAYMVSYNSYTWHHTDMDLNSAYITFSFAQGDIVSVTINPSTCKIIFERQGTAAYELPYQKVAGDQLFFCVSLSSHEQSVSIVK